jgi:hypothetical protein
MNELTGNQVTKAQFVDALVENNSNYDDAVQIAANS